MHPEARRPMKRDEGSFRDPSGYVFVGEKEILRTINDHALNRYRTVESTGLLRNLSSSGVLIESHPQDLSPTEFVAVGARGERACMVLRHPRLPFISYPYEWVFGQLKDAALTHLDVQISALDGGVVLSDATPYNVQWVSGRPQLIDVLSFRPYTEGEPWQGYGQFCRMFLFPLLLEAWAHVPFQPFLKARLEGLEVNEIAQMLPFYRKWLTLGGLVHVSLQERLSAPLSSATNRRAKRGATSITKRQYRALLTEMRALVSKLESGRSRETYWKTYDNKNSYTEQMRSEKNRFVSDFVAANQIESLWDLGGNSGDYSIAAIRAGVTHAIVMDSDIDALELAYRRARSSVHGMLPLFMDCADPSPTRGWRQRERKGLRERANADGILALALVHHLSIGRNIPLSEVIAWLVELSPHGVVEFVPKDDPMVVQMLGGREDVFADYCEANFRAAFAPRADITKEHRFDKNNRLLISYKRRQ